MKGDGQPVWYDLPQALVKEVPITHPDIEEFADLNLRWYGVPIIADMRLEIGGLSYNAAPFNGWYMGTEIGARNLADENGMICSKSRCGHGDFRQPEYRPVERSGAGGTE